MVHRCEQAEPGKPSVSGLANTLIEHEDSFCDAIRAVQTAVVVAVAAGASSTVAASR